MSRNSRATLAAPRAGRGPDCQRRSRIRDARSITLGYRRTRRASFADRDISRPIPVDLCNRVAASIKTA
jgi:hypothetical protein